jgi:hypothetical protein
LLFSYSPTRARLEIRKILQSSYAINRPVKSVKSWCSYYPLLYYDYRSVPGIRGRGIEFLISSNIAPIEDTEHKETCLPYLSGQKNSKHLNKRGRNYRLYPILYCIHTHASRILSFCRCHVKVWHSCRVAQNHAVLTPGWC